MFKRSVSIIMTILLGVMLFPTILSAGDDKGSSDPPMILDLLPCVCNCTITIESIIGKFPGHGAVVPVKITTDTDISAINLNIGYGTDVSLDSIGIDGSDWSENIDHFVGNQSNNPLNLQLLGAGNYIPGDEDTYTLFKLWFTISPNKSFGPPAISVWHDDDGNNYPAVNVKDDNPDQGFGLVTGVDGSISIINGQAWFDMGTEWAYSYQAQDSLYDESKKVFINIPVYFKANFPAKGVNIGIIINSDYMEFIPNASYNASASWCDVDLSSYDSLSISDDITVFQASESYYTLGHLKFVGHDYEEDYNDTPGYSHQDAISFYECDDPCDAPLVQCDSSEIGLDWADLGEDNGYIQYNQYKCYTTFADLYMDPRNIDLDMQVKARHFFWTQGFDYFVAVNDADFASINVTDPANEDPGNRYQYTSYQYKYSPDPYDIYQVFTDDSGTYFQQERYIPAYSNEEIFTIHLTPSQDFADCVGCTSEIDTYYDGSQHQNDISRNYDFFHPNSPQLDKIIRADTLANHFIVYSGTVTTPKLRLDVDDNVPCKDPTIVPVRIDDVVSNYYTRVKLYFTCEGGMRFDDISNGDYSISWGEPLITEHDTKLEIEGTMSQGELRAQRTLINLEFYTEELSVATQIYFDSALFADIETSPGQGPFKAVFTEDGSIKPCNGTGPKQDPCGDCPLPYTYFLSQAYPNPFNANTIIEFGLAEPGFVSFNIYDILGKKVRTLKSEDMEPGAYQAIWDGTNDTGAEVGSGFYFYIIQTGEFTDRKRMTLLK
ncbi:MAG: FlgD immunoglobulin-like domain containing protein [candidate division Zixibacteria bacterium]